MNGISFIGFHSYKAWGLLLQSKEIGSPAVKTSKIDIPGADGELDMTDYFGGTKFENTKLKFEFITLAPRTEYLSLFSTIKNAIHGKKGRIIIDGDSSFYYVGRCYVSSFTNDKGAGFVVIECDCEPYKYKMVETMVTRAVNGTEIINLTNGRKRAVPTITTTATMTISFGGGVWTHSAGTFIIPELELLEGNNQVAVTGDGSITFTWQEGDL